jgi:hypothetical protein
MRSLAFVPGRWAKACNIVLMWQRQSSAFAHPTGSLLVRADAVID